MERRRKKCLINTPSFPHFPFPLFTLLVTLLLASCSTERIAIKSSTAILNNTITALNEEEDPILAEKAIASQLKMLEGMIKSDPNNPELLLHAARGFCSYAFSFIEDYDKERAKIFYRRGLMYGLKILSRNELLSDGLKKGDVSLQTALSSMKHKDVPSLFWTAYCWGGVINLARNSPEALIAVPNVEKIMKRALQLNESYYYGGAHLFFGVLYGSKPTMLGGQPEKSRHHFTKALEITQRKFLITHVLFAKSYAMQTQDKALFESLLAQVLDSPPDILPAQRLANEVAKIKAKKLLQDINDYF